MVNGSTWEESTRARINEAKEKLLQYQDKMKQEEIEIEYWKRYISALESALNLSQHQNGHKPINSELFQTQSTWNNLKLFMDANNGILIVADAVDVLVEYKIFKDREHARNVIYSTLYSHKKDVEKVRQGIYQLKEKVTSKLIKARSKKHSQRIKTDIAQVVKQLKDENPQMTRNEVLNHLLKKGFDFKGKNPSKCLTMTWVKLGYHKEGKQQKLPLQNENLAK